MRSAFNWKQDLRPPDFLGLVLGVAFLWASLTPSLLPRVWHLQGILSGVVAAVGYGLGAAASLLLKRLIRRRPRPRLRVAGWLVLVVGATVSTVYQLWLSAVWQQDMRRLLGVPLDQGNLIATTIGTFALAIVVAVLVALLARLILVGLRGLYRVFSRRRVLARLPRAATSLVAVGLSAVVVLGVLNGVIPETFTAAAREMYRADNAEYPEGYDKPTSPLLSGSDDSLVSWASLGRQGRMFVAGWPDAGDIADFHGDADVKQPIRTYVGVEAESDVDDQVRLAIEELRRTGAFERDVLLVAVPTGTGSINPRATRSLEYITEGDVATVAVQYSFYPSWASFLIDRQRAARAGRAIIDAVHEQWAALDESSRPTLLVFGESLGSYGVESGVSDFERLVGRTDGVLLIGPPAFNPIWGALTQRRDPKSPEYLPRHPREPRVTFAADAEDLARHPAAPAPDLIYLQYPTDPVVKLDPDLLFSEPAWFHEQKRDGLLPEQAEWHPVVTFFQVFFDMLLTIDVPDGVGHRYGSDTIRAWLLLTGERMEADKIAELEALIPAPRYPAHPSMAARLDDDRPRVSSAYPEWWS